jgi:hypothetical protein
MHVILLFVKTVLYRLPLPLQVRLSELFYKGEASILKIYLQDKFSIYGKFGKSSIE